MDPVSKFLVELQDSHRRLGQGVLRIPDRQFQRLFRGFSNGLNFLLDGLVDLLLLVPPVLLALVIAGLA